MGVALPEAAALLTTWHARPQDESSIRYSTIRRPPYWTISRT